MKHQITTVEITQSHGTNTTVTFQRGLLVHGGKRREYKPGRPSLDRLVTAMDEAIEYLAASKPELWITPNTINLEYDVYS